MKFELVRTLFSPLPAAGIDKCLKIKTPEFVIVLFPEFINEIVEDEYTTYDDIQDDIMTYIVEEINIFEDELSGEIADNLDMLICSRWNEITTDE